MTNLGPNFLQMLIAGDKVPFARQPAASTFVIERQSAATSVTDSLFSV